MGNTVIVNKFGKMQGWTSVLINLFARDIEGITELEYSDEEKKENVKGAGKLSIGRAYGDVEAKASITLYKEEVDALKLSLPKGKTIRDIAPFDFTAEYETESGVILKDRIRNAEFTGDSVAVKQGDMTIATKYTLIISHIDWNTI